MTEPEPIRHAFTLGGHEDTVLCTHLPMLHMDLHAYHLVLSGRLPDEELAVYLLHREQHPGVAYWMGNDADDSMEIPDILSGTRTSFKASIWCGIPQKDAYESWPWEGVEPIVAGVEFGISDVLYDVKFDESEPYPAALRYILYGDDRVAYLHHRMVKNPDFDHLVELTRPPDGFGLDGPTAELVTFTSVARPDGTPCSSPVSAGRHVVANAGGQERTVDVGSTMWFSTKKYTPNLDDPCSGPKRGDA